MLEQGIALKMKRLFLVVSFLALVSFCGAQTRFTCSFTVVESTSGELVVSGKAFVQDSCYKCETPGGALYCNGRDRWIHDVANNELVIQKNDLSMLAGMDFSGLKGNSCTLEQAGFKISLRDIQPVQEAWPATFFIIDPESFGDDTIITDLR